MKKLFSFILAIVYLTSSVGATVHLHYCMNKLVNWSLKDEGGKCKNCGMEKDGGCCKDENKFVKNNLDQNLTSTIQFSYYPLIDSPGSFIAFNNNCPFRYINEYLINHGPPIKSGSDILVHNCIFRI